MSITLLQTTSKAAGAVNSSTLAYQGNTTAGSLLVVYIWQAGAGNSTLGASDGVNGSYHVDVTNFNGTGSTGAICSFTNAAGGAVTVTFTGTNSAQLNCIIEEWSGLATVAALDQIHSATYASSTAPSSGATPSTTQANELVLGLETDNSDTANVTAGSGFTLNAQNPGHLRAENQIVSSTGAQTATFILDTAEDGVCLVATYKAAAGAPAPILMGGICL